MLKASGIPHRAEAGGSALAVPAGKVHEVRLLLAASGLPRGGGVGFEIFDRGDLGISEFTQKVNLRRAIEGELSRTIGRLSPVRSARVHITLPEKGLYRSEERKASAAVVLNLQPGRSVDERELAGHSPPGVGRGRGAGRREGDRGGRRAARCWRGSLRRRQAGTEQREVETGLEQRIVDLLEPVVGRGSRGGQGHRDAGHRRGREYVGRLRPDTAAVRSERKVVEQMTNVGSSPGGAWPARPPISRWRQQPAAGRGRQPHQTSREDTLKNYEITKKTTRTVARTRACRACRRRC